MIDDWYDGDEISTGAVNGIPFRIVAGKDYLLEAYDSILDRFVVVSYWPTLKAAKSAAIERASHWLRRNSQAILDSSNSPGIPDGCLHRLLDKYQRINALHAADEKLHHACGNSIGGTVSGSMRVASCMFLNDLDRLLAGEEIDFPDHLPKPPKEVGRCSKP